VRITLREIAQLLNGVVVGRDSVIIENIRPIDEAGEGDITFVANRKYLKKLATTKAAAIIVSPQIQEEGKNLVLVDDPYAAFGKLMNLFYPLLHGYEGISPAAYIEEGATVSSEANVFPKAIISRGAKIDKGAVI